MLRSSFNFFNVGVISSLRICKHRKISYCRKYFYEAPLKSAEISAERRSGTALVQKFFDLKDKYYFHFDITIAGRKFSNARNVAENVSKKIFFYEWVLKKMGGGLTSVVQNYFDKGV